MRCPLFTSFRSILKLHTPHLAYMLIKVVARYRLFSSKPFSLYMHVFWSLHKDPSCKHMLWEMPQHWNLLFDILFISLLSVDTIIFSSPVSLKFPMFRMTIKVFPSNICLLIADLMCIYKNFASSNLPALPNISAMRTYATAPPLSSCMALSKENLPTKIYNNNVSINKVSRHCFPKWRE